MLEFCNMILKKMTNFRKDKLYLYNNQQFLECGYGFICNTCAKYANKYKQPWLNSIN